MCVGVSVDERSENPDCPFSLADEAVELAPGVEPRDLGCFRALSGDEENVPEAVVMKATLEGEVSPPLL